VSSCGDTGSVMGLPGISNVGWTRVLLVGFIFSLLTASAAAKIWTRNIWPLAGEDTPSVTRLAVLLIEVSVALLILWPRLQRRVLYVVYWGFFGAALTSLTLLPWLPTRLDCGCFGAIHLPIGLTVALQGLVLGSAAVLLRRPSRVR